MASHVISLDTDYLIKVNGVVDADGEAITNATVEVTLLESDGETEVAGETWPVTLTHQSAGNYQGELPYTVEVDPALEYNLKVIISAGTVTRSYIDNVYIDGNGSP